MSSVTSICVLVRVRPLLPRELDNACQCLVEMPVTSPTTTILHTPQSASSSSPSSASSSSRSATPNVGSGAASYFPASGYKSYEFDESIWLCNDLFANNTDNKNLYGKVGPKLLDQLFSGYNVCLLAYGQTGSGKTFTMLGSPTEPGIAPLLINDLLGRSRRLVPEKTACHLKMTYIEIYNEQVQDLLASDGTKRCRIREHPVLGPYAENAVEITIRSFADFTRYLKQGNKIRATAQTAMNSTSSRLHAIITLSLRQTKFALAPQGDESSSSIGEAQEELVSSIKLVDLAGSERLEKTKTFGQQQRMKEGSQINKSLTVLGRCINALSQNSISGLKTPVPYRDSALTYLLRENLGGNSKSFMIFCVSPVDYEETRQTLNYAHQVRKIKTIAKANKQAVSVVKMNWGDLLQQAPGDGGITALKQEVINLTEQLAKVASKPSPHRSDSKNRSTGDSNENEKMSRLMLYLERELDKVKFEKEYLKQRNEKQEREIKELVLHQRFVENEYGDKVEKITEWKRRHSKNTHASLLLRCTRGLYDIDASLERLRRD